jgi:hypothetical protein
VESSKKIKRGQIEDYTSASTQTVLNTKQNLLPNPITNELSSSTNPTYALQDGTILYHSVKWFTPTGMVSTSATTVTSIGTQFTATMVGAKITINGESRIITGFTSSTVVTVGVAFSTNYSGVVAGNWGVYSRESWLNSTFRNFLSSTGDVVFRTIAGNSVGFSNGIELTGNAGFYSDNFSARSDYRFVWSSTSSPFGTKDLGLRRNTAGLLEIYNGVTTDGTLANRRDVLLRNINASQYNITALNTAPSSTTATGITGEIRYTADFIYVCIATNTWKRSALSTW